MAGHLRNQLNVDKLLAPPPSPTPCTLKDQRWSYVLDDGPVLNQTIDSSIIRLLGVYILTMILRYKNMVDHPSLAGCTK